MRILGFSKHWVKLEEKEFTTFRFAPNNNCAIIQVGGDSRED